MNETHNRLWAEWYARWHEADASKPKPSYEDWLEVHIEALEIHIQSAIDHLRYSGNLGKVEEALALLDAALAGKDAVLRNGPAWSPPIVNPGFDTDVGGADVFKSWAEETGAVGIEATWRPVRFSQSMRCPLCHETFEIIVTANVRGAAWMDDLSAVVPSAALAEDEPKRLLPWDEYVKKVRAALARKA